MQGSKSTQTIKLLIKVSRAIYSVKFINRQIISSLSLSCFSKLLALVVQGLVVGKGVFRFEELPTERTVVLDEIVVDVSHVNLQHTPVLEPLSTILAIKV